MGGTSSWINRPYYSLLIGGSKYWKQSILLSSQGVLWLLPKWAAYDLEWYNHQKLSEDDTWFLRPLAWRTRRYIIWTFINNKLCKARRGWRCLPTTVPVDIVRHVCIESSPWLRWIKQDRALRDYDLTVQTHVRDERSVYWKDQSRALLRGYSGVVPTHSFALHTIA